jgi:hypothetical protein
MRMRSIVACVAALAASISASYPGPCWDDLSAVQAKIDSMLEAKAYMSPVETDLRPPTPPRHAPVMAL